MAVQEAKLADQTQTRGNRGRGNANDTVATWKLRLCYFLNFFLTEFIDVATDGVRISAAELTNGRGHVRGKVGRPWDSGRGLRGNQNIAQSIFSSSFLPITLQLNPKPATLVPTDLSPIDSQLQLFQGSFITFTVGYWMYEKRDISTKDLLIRGAEV